MSGNDWQRKIEDAIERIQTRYDFIGRKTGAPFLAIVYPPEVETAFLKEWSTHCGTLAPEFEVCRINVLDITQHVTGEIGAENVVSSLCDPMPGSDPQAELGELWITAITSAVQQRLSQCVRGKPVASLERLAALYPVAGPREVMQRLWDCAQSMLAGPVIVLIPGQIVESRTYCFVGQRNEFMYRGDLI